MVIEYVGELVRPVVGDIRDDIAVEKGKSTYMFRLDEGTMPVNSKFFCMCGTKALCKLCVCVMKVLCL
jgi:hypothetical protein